LITPSFVFSFTFASTLHSVPLLEYVQSDSDGSTKKLQKKERMLKKKKESSRKERKFEKKKESYKLKQKLKKKR